MLPAAATAASPPVPGATEARASLWIAAAAGARVATVNLVVGAVYHTVVFISVDSCLVLIAIGWFA